MQIFSMSTWVWGEIPEWSDADRLRKIRRMLHMSQVEFANQLGVTASTYAGWETGRNSVTDIRAVAVKVYEIAGIPVAWWFPTLDVNRTVAGSNPAGGATHVISSIPLYSLNCYRLDN